MRVIYDALNFAGGCDQLNVGDLASLVTPSHRLQTIIGTYQSPLKGIKTGGDAGGGGGRGGREGRGGAGREGDGRGRRGLAPGAANPQ